jgi:hypothetical protein
MEDTSSDLKMKTTLIQTVGLYRRGTWSVALREEHRLRVFGNRVLKKMFESKRDEIREKWRKLHN